MSAGPAPVVYWPLAPAPAAADHGPKHLLGYRLEPQTYCVVEISDAIPSLAHGVSVLGHCGVQLKSAKCVESCLHAQLNAHDLIPSDVRVATEQDTTPCHVILYDPALITRSHEQDVLVNSALHEPLSQIAQFLTEQRTNALNTDHTAQSPIEQACRSACEWIGFYMVFFPCQLLLVVANLLEAASSAAAPDWIPLIGGKCAKDLSLIVALSSHHFCSIASFPSRLRYFYRIKTQRPLTYHEARGLLELCNDATYLAVDAIAGFAVSRWLLPTALEHPLVTSMSPLAFLNVLRSNVVWVMGAPAGFKLNPSLASILGNGILLWFDLWESLLLSLGFSTSVASLSTSNLLASVWMNMGATLQCAVLIDLLAISTWYSYWVYLYFTKLNLLQFGLFSSLWKLFLGKKKNVFLKRVDSCEYDVGQLLLGTLLFTMMFFLVTTNSVFFVFFGIVRLLIIACQGTLWAPIVLLRTISLASIVVWLVHPQFFLAGVGLQTRFDLVRPIATLTLSSVQANKQQRHSQDGFDMKAFLQEAGQSSDRSNTYFQLAPVLSSVAVPLQRLGVYVSALAQHYPLSQVVRSWIFGSTLPSVSLALLFGSEMESAELS